MRIFVALCVLSTAAGAQPAIHVDVSVDVSAQPPATIAPPSVDVAPAEHPAEAPPQTPRRWAAAMGIVGQEPYGVRAEVDLAEHRGWLAGVAFGLAHDTMFTEVDAYDGVNLTDTSAVGYIARAARRGRFELRGAFGVGIVRTRVEQWGSAQVMENHYDVLSPVAELSTTASIDIYGPLTFAIGPMLSIYDQRFPSITPGVFGDHVRMVNLVLASGFRWAID
jgi:hypothetical protein